MKKILFLIVSAMSAFSLAARAADEPEAELAEAKGPTRWRISVGSRFAPKVKTKAGVSSRAVIDAAGKGRGAVSVGRSSSSSSGESSESVPVTPSSRYDFRNGFIDMRDDAGIPGETVYWHFDDASAFNEANGTITISESSSSETSRERSGTSQSRTVDADAVSSRDADVWGGDVEVGYDFWRGERLSLGIGLGATLYRSEDSVRVSGRSGRTTSSSTSVETSASSRETTVFSDPNLSYAGALDDIRNDDGSIGAGTPDGYTNPYGGNNPVLTVGDGTVTRTTSTSIRRDATTTRTLRAIDARAEGDVEMHELRFALQPSWRATDWFEMRGSVGAAATRVCVDADATILVNGERVARVSGDDSDWVFSGLCGLDLVFRPVSRVEVFVGGDWRFGGTDMDYSAGLVRGKVELPRHTLRAGLSFSF